jgi:predicted DNA-binding protein with PD1-like motif
MKLILQDGAVSIIRFDRGEEVLTELIGFVRQSKVYAGTFSAIGAAARVVISYYDLAAKKYFDMALDEVEIASLDGNIAILGGKPIVHAHGVFSGRDCIAKAGHVKEITVSGICEVRLEVLSEKLERMPDAGTGLNLLQ